MFAFHFVLSRKLGLAQYGALYTLISIATFIAVLGGILTIVIARLIAEHRTEPERLSLLCGSSLKQSAYIGAGVMLLMVVLAEPIAQFLRVSNVGAVLFLAVFAGGQLALSGLRGVLQGLQEFPRLATSLIVEAFVRTGLAIALAIVGFGIAAAIGAYALGTVVAIGYCLYAVQRSTRLRFGGSGLAAGRVARLSFGAALSTLAIAALGIVDVLLVRHYFSNAASSVYGAVSLAGKMVYFTVGFLPTIVLPKATAGALSGDKPARVLLPAAAIVFLMSAVSLAIFALFPGPVAAALAGHQYDGAVPYVFRYALAMTFLGASNAFVAYRLGVNDFSFIPAALLLVFAEAAGIVLFHRTLDEVIAIVIAVNAAVLLAVLFGLGKKGAFAPPVLEIDPMLIAEEIQAH
jgi:O-antigen/teichoic acid export membrane protein